MRIPPGYQVAAAWGSHRYDLHHDGRILASLTAWKPSRWRRRRMIARLYRIARRHARYGVVE